MYLKKGFLVPSFPFLIWAYLAGVFQQTLYGWIKIFWPLLLGRSSYIPMKPWISGNKLKHQGKRITYEVLILPFPFQMSRFEVMSGFISFAGCLWNAPVSTWLNIVPHHHIFWQVGMAQRLQPSVVMFISIHLLKFILLQR